MKRIALFITLLLILLSSAGCTVAKPVQDSDANSAAVSNTTTAIKTSAPTITPTEEPTPAPTPSPTLAPTETPAPAPLVFDVANVSMQSTPESSCFSEIGYDPDWEVLVAKFRDSDSIYTYSDFPEGEWNSFLAANSLGSWYNKYIKDKYECERIY